MKKDGGFTNKKEILVTLTAVFPETIVMFEAITPLYPF